MLSLLTERYISLITSLDIVHKRYFFNKIDFKDKMIGILGARGVGKTTFLLQYLKESALPVSKKLYISADSIEMSNVSLFELAKEFSSKGGKLLVIDEIHKYPNFQQHLKQIFDFLDLKIIFSGSSALSLENAKSDLSRRAVLYRVKGLSFREFLELKTGEAFKSYTLAEIMENHTDIAYEILKSIKPLEYFDEYIKKGCYPFYFENPNTYYKKLEEIINDVIESDLPVLFKIDVTNIVKLKKLVKLICISEPNELNISSLAKKVGINRQTLYYYINYMTLGNIFNVLRASTRCDAIFSKPEKIYLNNTNLNYCCCERQQIGTVRETFLVSQLNNLYEFLYQKKGDLLVDNRYLIEVGGKNKNFRQVKDEGYLALDGLESGYGKKIPLYLFGFLY